MLPFYQLSAYMKGNGVRCWALLTLLIVSVCLISEGQHVLIRSRADRIGPTTPRNIKGAGG